MRNGKNIEVTISPGTKDGKVIKLTNALQITDGRQGDILIKVRFRQTASKEGVFEVTDENFQEKVMGSNLPVLVDFWAPWCGPCRMVAPVVEKLAGEFSGKMKFCKLNVDENPQMSGSYQVMSIPLLLFFRDGQVVDKVIGAKPESELRSRIEAMLE